MILFRKPAHCTDRCQFKIGLDYSNITTKIRKRETDQNQSTLVPPNFESYGHKLMNSCLVKTYMYTSRCLKNLHFEMTRKLALGDDSKTFTLS